MNPFFRPIVINALASMFDMFGCEVYKKGRMQKDSYSKDRKVLLAGFGTAAVAATLFFLFMSWLSEQVHLAQFSLNRFGH